MILSGWMFLGFIGHGLIVGYSYTLYEDNFDNEKGLKLIFLIICMVRGAFILKEGWKDNPWFKHGWRVW